MLFHQLFRTLFQRYFSVVFFFAAAAFFCFHFSLALSNRHRETQEKRVCFCVLNNCVEKFETNRNEKKQTKSGAHAIDIEVHIACAPQTQPHKKTSHTSNRVHLELALFTYERQ